MMTRKETEVSAWLRSALERLADDFDTSGWSFTYDSDGDACVAFNPNPYFGGYLGFRGTRLADAADLDRNSPTYKALAAGHWLSFGMYESDEYVFSGRSNVDRFWPSAHIWESDIAGSLHEVQPTDAEEDAMSRIFIPLFIAAARRLE